MVSTGRFACLPRPGEHFSSAPLFASDVMAMRLRFGFAAALLGSWRLELVSCRRPAPASGGASTTIKSAASGAAALLGPRSAAFMYHNLSLRYERTCIRCLFGSKATSDAVTSSRRRMVGWAGSSEWLGNFLVVALVLGLLKSGPEDLLQGHGEAPMLAAERIVAESAHGRNHLHDRLPVRATEATQGVEGRAASCVAALEQLSVELRAHLAAERRGLARLLGPLVVVQCPRAEGALRRVHALGSAGEPGAHEVHEAARVRGDHHVAGAAAHRTERAEEDVFQAILRSQARFVTALQIHAARAEPVALRQLLNFVAGLMYADATAVARHDRVVLAPVRVRAHQTHESGVRVHLALRRAHLGHTGAQFKRGWREMDLDELRRKPAANLAVAQEDRGKAAFARLCPRARTETKDPLAERAGATRRDTRRAEVDP
eukprot:scaffold1144_cov215-Pinguiococcus_pyrenoidosus.AAC.6